MQTMNSSQGSGYWIEERALVPRWSTGVSGLVNLAVLIAAVGVIWWVFFSIEGVFKLYTPLLGFSLVIWTLLIILWQAELFDFWPFGRNFLKTAHPLAKGAVFTAITIAIYLVLIFGVLFFLIGKFGITYFNWNSLVQYGEFGQDVMSTRETTSWAMLCLSIPFFLISVWFMRGVGRDLFHELSQPKLGLANLLFVAVLAIPLYVVFFHPHLGSMFYPKQVYTAVPPWWESIAQTNSAEYTVGILFCSVIGVFYTLMLWDGWPLDRVQKQPWRFLYFAAGSLVLGYLIFRIQLYIFDWIWYEAYIGGQNTANFGWRYSHTVTMANFVLVIAIIQNLFFGGFYEKMHKALAGAIKTVVAILLGLAFAWAYYSWGPALLGVTRGVSHPSENASAFLILTINILMIMDLFMDRWPGYRLKG
jgi:AAT family amino acid transporter